MFGMVREIRLPMIGGTPAEQTLKELVEMAKKRENWFGDPNESAEAAAEKTELPRPEGGHHGKLLRRISVEVGGGRHETYDVVFTVTKGQLLSSKDNSIRAEVLFRHATISTGAQDRLPEPPEVFTIINFLGFRLGEAAMIEEHPQYPGLVIWQPFTEKETNDLKMIN